MLSFDEILSATSGRALQAGSGGKIKNFSINSRAIRAGQVFIAIKGDRFDGHDFVDKAVKAGACGVVVSKDVSAPERVFVVKVKDTTKALGDLARMVREKFPVPVVAVTGSAGKTTTKEMIAAVLGRKYKVLKNERTKNNHIGIPLTLFKFNKSHQAAVLEIGTNQPGDIAWLAGIIRPDVAVFTNIGESHLERLGDPAGVFKEKSQVLRFLSPRGTVIYNSDDPYLRSLGKIKGPRKISFGVESAADYRASGLRPAGGARWVFTCRRKKIETSGPARHHIYNALSALSCGRLFGVRYNDILSALSRAAGLPGRLRCSRSGAIVIIDDTYNANPLSFRGAIETLVNIPASGRRIMVISDMLELGPQAQRLHWELGGRLALAGLDVVCGYGPLARHAIAAVGESSGKDVSVMHSEDKNQLHEYLSRTARAGDVILVKGSRAMKMDQTVEFLRTLKKEKI
jgi:UDP-N-acetylmuramoyl-tripeptide--D-alanyl-D-alanine ligase